MPLVPRRVRGLLGRGGHGVPFMTLVARTSCGRARRQLGRQHVRRWPIRHDGSSFRGGIALRWELWQSVDLAADENAGENANKREMSLHEKSLRRVVVVVAIDGCRSRGTRNRRRRIIDPHRRERLASDQPALDRREDRPRWTAGACRRRSDAQRRCRGDCGVRQPHDCRRVDLVVGTCRKRRRCMHGNRARRLAAIDPLRSWAGGSLGLAAPTATCVGLAADLGKARPCLGRQDGAQGEQECEPARHDVPRTVARGRNRPRVEPCARALDRRSVRHGAASGATNATTIPIARPPWLGRAA